MPALEHLPRDQRAVLSLVLERGRRYEDIAALLRIDAEAVRERAHSALEALGPRDGSPPPAARRAEIADYLLAQQSDEQRARTRGYLEDSAAGRAWARVVAGELTPLAATPLPELPQPAGRRHPPADADTVVPPPAATSPPGPPVSRRGGAIVLALAGAAALAALIVILLSGGGGGRKTARTTASTTTQATATRVVGQVNLVAPPNGGGGALGVATLLAQGSQQALAIQAQGLRPTSSRLAYAVWLYNSHADAQRIGYAPAVTRSGRLAAVAPAPASLGRYRTLIVTRETSANGTRPGPIVLGGRLPGH